MAKSAVVSKEVAIAFTAVDTYPDHKSVSELVVVGADKTCTNFGNTGDESWAKVAVDERNCWGTFTCTGANLGLSEKETSVKHGYFIFEVTWDSVSHYVLSSEKHDPLDTAPLTKLLDAFMTTVVH